MPKKETVRLIIHPPPRNEIIKTRPPATNRFEGFEDKCIQRRKSVDFTKTVSPSGPIYFSNYNSLLDKLMKQNAELFTPDRGKNRKDFEKYLQNKTDLYNAETGCMPELEPKLNLSRETFSFYKKKKFSSVPLKRGMKFINKKTKAVAEKKVKQSAMEERDVFIGNTLEPFEYKLSDPEMLRLGITVDTKVAARRIKLFNFRALLVEPLVSAFLHLQNDLFYENGQLCNGQEKHKKILYNDRGKKSISYMKTKLGYIIIVYSEKKIYNEGIWEQIPLAIFDMNGHGVVYDEQGKKRLIYDQAQGIWFDTPIKLPLKWKWKSFDRIIGRRKELKFVKPDDLADIESDEKRKQRLKKEMLSKKSKKKKKPERGPSVAADLSPRSSSPSRSISKKMEKDEAAQSESGDMMKGKEVSQIDRQKYSPENDINLVKNMLGDTKKQISMSTRPVILKFSQTGCSYEPLEDTCMSILKGIQPATYRSLEEEKLICLTTFKKVKPKSNLLKDLLTKCLPKVSQTLLQEHAHSTSSIKPIVLKITREVSLVVLNQNHIHIDFSCSPHHFTFEIGVTVNDRELVSLYSVVCPEETNALIPCVFEVMQNKVKEYQLICQRLKKVRENARRKYEKDYQNYLKYWGYNIFLNKIPEELLQKDFVRI